MNAFNKKSLYVAVAGLTALGATGVAQAVSLNPDGLGQVLIYPYYTVRSTGAGATFDSLLTVVNSTASAKAVKVRFLEGKNSREVLDFNLYLSKHDVWTAAIVPTALGAGIFTTDKSCTRPVVSSDSTNPTPFVNFAYTNDGADTSLDRTREGYVEIIEMGNITGGSTTETAVTHVSGVPPCSPLSDAVGGQTDLDTVAGNGGLFGEMALVNVLKPDEFGYTATALDSFSQTKLWRAPGDVNPTLASVNPAVSVVTSGNTTYVTQWPSPPSNSVDAVSAVLMHDNVYNEYVLDASLQAGTDWVMTMPTKRFYVSNGTGQPPTLFQRNFNGNSGACDDVVITQYDREERTVQTAVSFSPPPPTQTNSICWEATVVTFNGSNVLASSNSQNISPTAFQDGWIGINFNGTSVPAGAHVLVGGTSTTFNTSTGTTGTFAASTTFMGLPIVGFAAENYNNNTLTNSAGVLVNSAYGVLFNHRFTRSISGQ